MKLSLEAVPEYNQIHAYDQHKVIIRPKNQTGLEQVESNFILTPEQLIQNWPVADLSQLADAALDELKSLDPEVILFATGSGLTAELQHTASKLMRDNIGVEFMELGAACRTYNLLLAEHRKVLLAVIF